jgi:hypothetical protein
VKQAQRDQRALAQPSTLSRVAIAVAVILFLLLLLEEFGVLKF